MGLTVLSVSPRKTITPLPSTCFSSKMAKVSQIRQNYHEECEALVNKQANMKLYHGYVYMSMATYFTRDDLALAGFANFFKKAYEKQGLHAAAFMKYQTVRGGKVVLQDIPKPKTLEWGTPLEVMTYALDLQNMYATAMTKGDYHLVNFLQKFLNKQINDIKLIGNLVTKIKMVGDGLGIHMVDEDIMEFYTAQDCGVKGIIKKIKNVDIANTEFTADTFLFDTTF